MISGLWRRVLIVAGVLMATEATIWLVLLHDFGFGWWFFVLGLAVTPPAVWLLWRIDRAKFGRVHLSLTVGYVWLWFVVFGGFASAIAEFASYLTSPESAFAFARALLTFPIVLAVMSALVAPLYTILGIWLWLPFAFVVWALMRWQFPPAPRADADATPPQPGASDGDPVSEPPPPAVDHTPPLMSLGRGGVGGAAGPRSAARSGR